MTFQLRPLCLIVWISIWKDRTVSRKPQTQPSLLYTLLGYSALLLWSFSASCAVILKNLPSFEVLTITFFGAFLYCALRITHTRKWKKLKQPWYVWAIGIIGVCGQQILYIFSFKYAPAVQADLIIYTWPIMVVLLSQFIKKRKNFKRTLLAALMGFAGVALLFIAEPSESTSFTPIMLLGYLMAFLCAIIWSSYTVASKNFKCPSEIVGFYTLGGSAICALLHLSLEETVMPTPYQWLILGLMGVGIAGIAYYLWDKGIKKGNFQILSLLSYTNPILSITWLYLFGFGELHLIIIASACMIIFGAFWGGVTPKQWQYFMSGIQHLRVFLRLKDKRSTLTVIRQQRVVHGDYLLAKNRIKSRYKRKFMTVRPFKKTNVK